MKITAELNYSPWFKLIICIPLAILLLGIMLKYEAVCTLGAQIHGYISLEMVIDEWIPFNYFVIYPYIFCLLYAPLSGLLYSFYRKVSAVDVIAFYLSTIGIWLSSYVIYLVFPTTAKGVMINSFDPELLNLGMFHNLHLLYTTITHLGDFPSVHVAPLVFMGIFLYKKWRSFFWIFLPLSVVGGLGTVLLKFHTFIGLLGGVFVGIFGYYFLYKNFILVYVTGFFENRTHHNIHADLNASDIQNL